MGILNMLGGRWDDVMPNSPFSGRLVFRCLMPGVLAGWLAHMVGYTPIQEILAWAAVTIGSGLWYPFGWSFDEITGGYDTTKYPAWIQKIGRTFVSVPSTPHGNRQRGIVMKGLRGGFDIVTFAGLYFINPLAPYFFAGTLLMGYVYWLCGRLVPQQNAVETAEFTYGIWRGMLIGLAVSYG